MSKKEIEIKTALSAAEAASYLRELATCLEQGRVVLQRGAEFIELTPGQAMELELEAAEKKDRQKLSLELSWRLCLPEQPAAVQLKISSEPPQPVEEEPAKDETADAAVAETSPADAAVTTPPAEEAVAAEAGADDDPAKAKGRGYRR